MHMCTICRMECQSEICQYCNIETVEQAKYEFNAENQDLS